MNKQSQVHIGDSNGVFSFRNPPHFVTLRIHAPRRLKMRPRLCWTTILPPERRTIYCQVSDPKFTTSNPSPNYVQAVEAFRTGLSMEGILGHVRRLGCCGSGRLATPRGALGRVARYAGKLREPIVCLFTCCGASSTGQTRPGPRSKLL